MFNDPKINKPFLQSATLLNANNFTQFVILRKIILLTPEINKAIFLLQYIMSLEDHW